MVESDRFSGTSIELNCKDTPIMIEITGKSSVAGQWLRPSGASFQSFNPVTKSPMFSFTSCGSVEVEQATKAAAEAFQVFRRLDGKAIGRFLHTIAEQVEALGDQLLAVADSETALGMVRLTGERGRTCAQLRAFGDLVAAGEWVQASIDTAIPGRAPVPKPDLRRMLKGIGPVAVFGASNFPFAFSVAGGDTASALAAGNPVIVKGHPSHPATSELFARAINRAMIECDIPAGVFSLLQGVDNALGTKLVEHPVIQAVGFTGSEQGGRALMDVAAARPRPIPVHAEMGSINPLFIGPKTLEAHADAIAEGLSGSVCMGTGQFCTSPGLAVSLASERFETRLKQQLSDTPRGHLLSPQIARSLAKGLEYLQQHPHTECLNPSDFDTDSLMPPNSVFKTTAKAFLADPGLAAEVFGPVTLYVVCGDEAEIMTVARSLNGNLTASIHADEDPELRTRLQNTLEQKAGRVIFNGYPTGVEVCPSQQHGGPYPASSLPGTSVGTGSIERFARFVAFQDCPDATLPEALKNDNPLGIHRRLNGVLTRERVLPE
jgi:NADP-dependent aldehyde dehydrogenase